MSLKILSWVIGCLITAICLFFFFNIIVQGSKKPNGESSIIGTTIADIANQTTYSGSTEHPPAISTDRSELLENAEAIDRLKAAAERCTGIEPDLSTYASLAAGPIVIELALTKALNTYKDDAETVAAITMYLDFLDRVSERRSMEETQAQTESSVPSQLERLIDLEKQYTGNADINGRILSECLDTRYNCSQEYVTEVAKAASNTTHSWVALAILWYRFGDSEKAICALDMALSAPELGSRFIPDLQRLDQGIPMAVFGDATALVAAQTVGFGVSNDRVTSALVRTCTSAENRLYAHQCFNLGQRVIDESKSLIEQRLGLAIQKKTIEWLKAPNLTEQLNINLSEDEKGRALHQLHNETAGMLFMHDPEIADTWWQTMLEDGENEAVKSSIILGLAKAQDPEYAPCK